MALNTISTKQLQEMLTSIGAAVEAEKNALSDLDSVIGDGDHGVGMANGFRIGVEELSRIEEESIEEMLRVIGDALIHNVGGVSGSIFGAVFLGMGQGAKGKAQLNLSDFAQMFSLGLHLAQKRGNAVPGDKTMIDALHPAVESLQSAAREGMSLVEGFSNAARSARAGAEHTKNLIGKRGRAKYFREKAIGYQDAGATTVAVIIEAIAENSRRLETRGSC
jgi:dihydroxyacetone kinase-like protein